MSGVGRSWFVSLVVLALLAGCGGSGDTTNPGAASGPVDSAYAAKADAFCLRALRQTKQLGREFTAQEVSPSASNLLGLTTEMLIRPGIAIRAELAARLRALPPPSRGEESAAAFIELFDPLDALARERLRVGLAGDLGESNRLERLMRELANEQQAAARLAGLDACATDFVGAAFAASSGR